MTQARLLEAWTGLQLRAGGPDGHSSLHQPQQQHLQQQYGTGACRGYWQQAGAGAGAEGQSSEGGGVSAVGSAGTVKGVRVGPGGRRHLLLFGDVWLDLAELDTETEEAAQARMHALQQRQREGRHEGGGGAPAQQQQQQQQRQQRHTPGEPVTLVLPASVSEVLLRHHPSEGVRWQVSVCVPCCILARVLSGHAARTRRPRWAARPARASRRTPAWAHVSDGKARLPQKSCV